MALGGIRPAPGRERNWRQPRRPRSGAVQANCSECRDVIAAISRSRFPTETA